MKLLVFLAMIAISSAYAKFRFQRDISEIQNNNYYTSNNYDNYPYKDVYNDYPKSLTEVLPPKINRLYLPVEPSPIPSNPPGRHVDLNNGDFSHFEGNLQPLPSENRPKYAGNGNYIFEIQAETDNTQKVDVENPFFKNTIHFVE